MHITAYNGSRSLGIKYYHKPLVRKESQLQESDSWWGISDVCVCTGAYTYVSYDRNLSTEITVQL